MYGLRKQHGREPYCAFLTSNTARAVECCNPVPCLLTSPFPLRREQRPVVLAELIPVPATVVQIDTFPFQPKPVVSRQWDPSDVFKRSLNISELIFIYFKYFYGMGYFLLKEKWTTMLQR
jgi:hypothetical protein